MCKPTYDLAPRRSRTLTGGKDREIQPITIHLFSRLVYVTKVGQPCRQLQTVSDIDRALKYCSICCWLLTPEKCASPDRPDGPLEPASDLHAPCALKLDLLSVSISPLAHAPQVMLVA